MPVCSKRLGLPSRSVEREHALGVDSLAERVLIHEGFELADELYVTSEGLQLDIGRFTVEMDDHIYLQRIREQVQGGRESGVRSTPTFFVDGRIQDVSFGLRFLFDAVDAALAK